MKKNCKTENCPSMAEVPDNPTFSKFPFYCPECCKKHSAEAAQRAEKELRDSRVASWKKICPIDFQETDIGRLPRPEKAQEVLSWIYGRKGLLLHGETGTGKSRCAWLLCERVFNTGKSIQILGALAGFEYAGIFEGGGRAVNDWIECRCKCGLLFFDDVFKVKLTDSFEAAVFAIVDYRLSNGLPILATLNDTGDTLAARMSSDRGDALVRRLKEMCDVIQF
jgi:DNA replication protein DnaC